MTGFSELTKPDRRHVLQGLAAAFATSVLPAVAAAATRPSTSFIQAVAEASAGDEALAAFYRETGYAALWTGSDDLSVARRQTLLTALDGAGRHGLPTRRFSPHGTTASIRAVRTERDLGHLEVDLSRTFLSLARSTQTGIVTPSRVDQDLVMDVPHRDRTETLIGFARSAPEPFFRDLAPAAPEYVRLMKAALDLERQIARGGWGDEVPGGGTLRPGESGRAVVALRNRLIARGYLARTASPTYDSRMQTAVRRFQTDHGLVADGVAGPGTIEEVNVGPERRLSQVLVAMERERWMNTGRGRGKTHIWVNLTDFRTKLYDHDRVSFETISVVGDRQVDKRTPEFSDEMTYMEVNPTWTVPRSILGRDYLPKFKQNPYAARYLQLIDRQGRVVPREYINFHQYNARNFPFTVRQPPSERNALGRVKFMFPNPHAIYLHDTPQKHLFQREVRAFSSGCIRLNDPFDFAYELLGRQMTNPREYFDAQVNSRQQRRINLDTPIPVHLTYRTAFTDPRGAVQFRRDFYGRDAAIWEAMREAGVTPGSLRG